MRSEKASCIFILWWWYVICETYLVAGLYLIEPLTSSLHTCHFERDFWQLYLLQPLTAFAVVLHLANTDSSVALQNTRMLSDISANVGYHQQQLRAAVQNSACLSGCLLSNQRSIFFFFSFFFFYFCFFFFYLLFLFLFLFFLLFFCADTVENISYLAEVVILVMIESLVFVFLSYILVQGHVVLKGVQRNNKQ